jgi:hypothetical protein
MLKLKFDEQQKQINILQNNQNILSIVFLDAVDFQINDKAISFMVGTTNITIFLYDDYIEFVGLDNIVDKNNIIIKFDNIKKISKDSEHYIFTTYTMQKLFFMIFDGDLSIKNNSNFIIKTINKKIKFILSLFPYDQLGLVSYSNEENLQTQSNSINDTLVGIFSSDSTITGLYQLIGVHTITF